MTKAMPFLQKYDITFLRPPTIYARALFGGAEGIRTPDPNTASVVRSQLR